MANQIDVSTYYQQEVPRLFEEMLGGASNDVTSQPDMTATYEISGEGGGIYGVRISSGKLEIIEGGIPHSDMRVVADVAEWREGAQAGMANPFDYYRRRKVALIKTFKGAVNLDLTQDGGANLTGRIVFGDVDEPSVTIHMKATDYLAMMMGKLNGQMAFMTGKVKFDGNLPLLMQVAALNG